MDGSWFVVRDPEHPSPPPEPQAVSDATTTEQAAPAEGQMNTEDPSQDESHSTGTRTFEPFASIEKDMIEMLAPAGIAKTPPPSHTTPAPIDTSSPAVHPLQTHVQKVLNMARSVKAMRDEADAVAKAKKEVDEWGPGTHGSAGERRHRRNSSRDEQASPPWKAAEPKSQPSTPGATTRYWGEPRAPRSPACSPALVPGIGELPPLTLNPAPSMQGSVSESSSSPARSTADPTSPQDLGVSVKSTEQHMPADQLQPQGCHFEQLQPQGCHFWSPNPHHKGATLEP